MKEIVESVTILNPFCKCGHRAHTHNEYNWGCDMPGCECGSGRIQVYSEALEAAQQGVQLTAYGAGRLSRLAWLLVKIGYRLARIGGN